MLRKILQTCKLTSSQFSPSLTTSISRSLNIPFKTQRYFQDLSLDDLVNRKFIRKIIRTKLPGTSMKSHRGLYHGLQVRSGHRVSPSKNKIKRRFNPNVQKKMFFSNILKKTIKLNITHKALKCIEKYGGFDNYILLTKPQNMCSLFGEFLRKLMIEKLNNSDLNLTHCKIFGTTPDTRSKLNKKTPSKNSVWFPKEVRHKDQTMRYWRGFNEMTKEELRLIKETIENPHDTSEIVKKYSRFQTDVDQIKLEEAAMLPKIERNKRMLARRNPEHVRLYEFQVEDAQKDLRKND